MGSTAAPPAGCEGATHTSEHPLKPPHHQQQQNAASTALRAAPKQPRKQQSPLDRALAAQSDLVAELLLPTPTNVNLHIPGGDLLHFIGVQSWVQDTLHFQLPLLDGMFVLVRSAELQQPATADSNAAPAAAVCAAIPWRLRQLLRVEAGPLGSDPAAATVVLVGGEGVAAGSIGSDLMMDVTDYQYLCCELAELQLSGRFVPLQVQDIAHMSWQLKMACQVEGVIQDMCLQEQDAQGGPAQQQQQQQQAQQAMQEVSNILRALPPSDWVTNMVMQYHTLYLTPLVSDTNNESLHVTSWYPLVSSTRPDTSEKFREDVELNPGKCPESPDQPWQLLSAGQYNQLLQDAAGAWQFYIKQRVAGQAVQPLENFAPWMSLPGSEGDCYEMQTPTPPPAGGEQASDGRPAAAPAVITAAVTADTATATAVAAVEPAEKCASGERPLPTSRSGSKRAASSSTASSSSSSDDDGSSSSGDSVSSEDRSRSRSRSRQRGGPSSSSRHRGSRDRSRSRTPRSSRQEEDERCLEERWLLEFAELLGPPGHGQPPCMSCERVLQKHPLPAVLERRYGGLKGFAESRRELVCTTNRQQGPVLSIKKYWLTCLLQQAQAQRFRQLKHGRTSGGGDGGGGRSSRQPPLWRRSSGGGGGSSSGARRRASSASPRKREKTPEAAGRGGGAGGGGGSSRRTSSANANEKNEARVRQATTKWLRTLAIMLSPPSRPPNSVSLEVLERSHPIPQICLMQYSSSGKPPIESFISGLPALMVARGRPNEVCLDPEYHRRLLKG